MPWLRTLLVLTLAAALVACGGDGGGTEAVTTAADVVASEPDPPAADGADKDPGALIEQAVEGGTEPAAEATSDASDGADMVIANGVGLNTGEAVHTFGEDAESVIAAVTAVLGPPTFDSGTQPAGGGSGCGADYRYVGWGEDLVLTILEASVYASGFAHFASWQANPGDGVVTPLSFIGDETVVPVIPGATTVAELEAALGEAVMVVDEPPLGPSFFIADNFGTLFGGLSSTADDGVVDAIVGGEGCGE